MIFFCQYPTRGVPQVDEELIQMFKLISDQNFYSYWTTIRMRRFIIYHWHVHQIIIVTSKGCIILIQSMLQICATFGLRKKIQIWILKKKSFMKQCCPHVVKVETKCSGMKSCNNMQLFLKSCNLVQQSQKSCTILRFPRLGNYIVVKNCREYKMKLQMRLM